MRSARSGNSFGLSRAKKAEKAGLLPILSWLVADRLSDNCDVLTLVSSWQFARFLPLTFINEILENQHPFKKNKVDDSNEQMVYTV